MGRINNIFKHRLAAKLIASIGIVLALCLAAWTWFTINHQRQKLTQSLVRDVDRLSTTIKLGTRYAMMLNARPDIAQIINDIAGQKEIRAIRIYNKAGNIRYSNKKNELNQHKDTEDKACRVCHQKKPPLKDLPISMRTRFIKETNGRRLMGVITPIENEKDCSTAACHFHDKEQSILGVLDVVVSLENQDRFVATLERWTIGFSLILFSAVALIVWLVLMRFVNQPIRNLIRGTRRIAMGEHDARVPVNQSDEIGRLAAAINQMADKIGKKQEEINRQKQEYQKLFEQVPCFITVVDRTFRLTRFNREFAVHFEPDSQAPCYFAYKGRQEKCENCPVEKTFSDGRPHFAEESGLDKYGETRHWIVRTSPISDESGHVVAAMEMCLDITPRKRLEEQLRASEKKYYAIFNNIPNPVFVLDIETFEILDCNDSVETIYGYSKQELISRPFTYLFHEDEADYYKEQIAEQPVINKAKQFHRDGGRIYVNIRISPSEYAGFKVLL
ncbi:MAG: PAS domain S-box protein, partial [Desulfosalsimonadaceae bacterium]